MLDNITNNLWMFIAIPLLIFCGILFTIKLRCIQIRKIPLMGKVLFKTNENGTGITGFQSFSMAMAARVGVGSLAGVALALRLGGYGTIFWMWIIAFLGSASAFVESTLAQIYKEKKGDITYGGVAYYIKKGLNWKALSIIFAIILAITYGIFYPMVQSNTITGSLKDAYNFSPYIVGIILIILFSAIIFGGTKSIAKVTEKLVPFMAVSYLLIGMFLIFANVGMLGGFFDKIMQDAFKFNSVLSASFLTILIIGIKRGIFSNEAGMGTSATTAAAGNVEYASESGLVQILGVLITTFIISTITAFIVFSAHIDLLSYSKEINGIEITQEAMKYHFGDLGLLFLSVAIFMFAFSTILTGYYFLESNMLFIVKKNSIIPYLKVITITIIFIGAIVSAKILWSAADLGTALLASINGIMLILLFKKAIKRYKKDVIKLEKKK